MGGIQSKDLIRVKIQGDNLTGTFIYDQNEVDAGPDYVKYVFYTHTDKRLKRVIQIDQKEFMEFKGITYSYNGDRKFLRQTLDQFDPNQRELSSLLDILELECQLKENNNWSQKMNDIVNTCSFGFFHQEAIQNNNDNDQNEQSEPPLDQFLEMD